MNVTLFALILGGGLVGYLVGAVVAARGTARAIQASHDRVFAIVQQKMKAETDRVLADHERAMAAIRTRRNPTDAELADPEATLDRIEKRLTDAEDILLRYDR